MIKAKKILAINPGATSTKYGIFAGEEAVLQETVRHPYQELSGFARVVDQFDLRLNLITEAMARAGFRLEELDAVVGRGGLLKPLAGGTYLVNDAMLRDLRAGVQGEHASNLGGIMAYYLAERLGIPAFVVDPVAVDEMDAIARLSGLPDLPRKSLSHALNMKAVARRVAKEMGRSYFDLNLVVAHLGSGISVSPHQKGRMIDVNNALNEGPFSPERTGGLPALELVKLCYSGKYTLDQMTAFVTREGGMYAYLGTKDLKEAEEMAAGGDLQAKLVLESMAYQIAKEIGAMAAVLAGEVDRVVLTGGMAYSQSLVDKIIARVKFIAPVAVVPGEEELPSLAQGALRVLNGEEEAKIYR
jgi:butyrate kinase